MKSFKFNILADTGAIADEDYLSSSATTATATASDVAVAVANLTGASIDTETIAIISGSSVGSLFVISVLIFTIWKICFKEPVSVDIDDNPTYGDYADYSEAVVEVEDSNVYYGEGEEEEGSRVTDRNSNYEE